MSKDIFVTSIGFLYEWPFSIDFWQTNILNCRNYGNGYIEMDGYMITSWNKEEKTLVTYQPDHITYHSQQHPILFCDEDSLTKIMKEVSFLVCKILTDENNPYKR